ncbi:peptide-methionine (S)-S-oxide reductase MsrA [Candidatus Saccharibacteria bacterium]|nr:peptide-methionine (S)-S-oxide reductase MsrA [Candidatus Saccharibacteria bacterium]
MKTIVLGGGCFWCIEAVFQQVKGVENVISGYAGGTTDNPNYSNIGDHAEVAQISYDEKVINLEQILEIFFGVHDPTTLNFQGNDYGEQYRSIILCKDSELETANKAKEMAQNNWDDPIVTEIKILDKFYPAETYHQNYYNNNTSAGYCQVVINPKLDKFRNNFKKYLKD